MIENVACENRLRKYGAEAFLRHREEVCAAVRTVCFCLEYLQNEKNWSGRRVLVWDDLYGYLRPEEKEKDWKKYDGSARQKAYRELERELKERKWRIGEQEIPLRNFLRMGLMLLTEKAGSDGIGDEIQLMESQMEINRFQDFREFLEAVYLLGFTESMEMQDMDDRSSLEGEHRDAERFLKALRPYIPEEGQGAYGLFCRELLEEQARERRKAMERIMEEREERLTQAVGEISLFRLFREAMEGMSEEEFQKLVTPGCEEDEICGWEELPGEEQESIRRERKTNRIRNLAGVFVYGGSDVRQRLLGRLSGEEQMLVMEQWMAAYYPRDKEMLENRLRRMDWIAEPEEFSLAKDWQGRVIKEAVEKLLGRTLQNGRQE